MAPTRNKLHLLKIAAVTVVFISSLTFLPSKSDGEEISSYKESMQQRKMVLGSRPPGCVNKCLNCRPCMATLVIPPHEIRRRGINFRPSFHREDDTSYYLISWKCRCGDKLFHP